jgi:hypothetical protein
MVGESASFDLHCRSETAHSNVCWRISGEWNVSMGKQNTSHAVMAQRFEAKDSLDDFPTPPWATRALLEHIILDKNLPHHSVWEPACGEGHMAKVLQEYFERVVASDIFAYGCGEVVDFLAPQVVRGTDWIITNPPFRLAEAFALKALSLANTGVALLVRTVFIESVGRHERLFSRFKPALVAQFTERVAMVKGRLDPKASTATGYAWIVWLKCPTSKTQLIWIPRCRKRLERPTDYLPLSSQQKLPSQPTLL